MSESTATKDLIEYIVKAIIRHPEDVNITQIESEDGQNITLRISVNPADMGSIIGREGNVARALRSIAKSTAIKHHQKVFIDILEAGEQPAEEVEDDSLASEQE